MFTDWKASDYSKNYCFTNEDKAIIHSIQNNIFKDQSNKKYTYRTKSYTKNEITYLVREYKEQYEKALHFYLDNKYQMKMSEKSNDYLVEWIYSKGIKLFDDLYLSLMQTEFSINQLNMTKDLLKAYKSIIEMLVTSNSISELETILYDSPILLDSKLREIIELEEPKVKVKSSKVYSNIKNQHPDNYLDDFFREVAA